MNGELLLDNSAWARLWHPSLHRRRVGEVAKLLEAGRLVACLPFALEAGYPARGPKEHDELVSRLLELPFASIDEAVERLAIDAQRQLARAGHHRLPPADLLTAAIAVCHELGVLHYDADFDVISAHTDLRFDSVWLIPRGTL